MRWVHLHWFTFSHWVDESEHYIVTCRCGRARKIARYEDEGGY